MKTRKTEPAASGRPQPPDCEIIFDRAAGKIIQIFSPAVKLVIDMGTSVGTIHVGGSPRAIYGEIRSGSSWSEALDFMAAFTKQNLTKTWRKKSWEKVRNLLGVRRIYAQG